MNIKTALSYTIGRELSEHEIFRIMVAITQDYPESNIWELYVEKQIKKVHERQKNNNNH